MVQHRRDLMGDRHLHAHPLRQQVRVACGRDTFGDLADLGEDLGELATFAEREADTPVRITVSARTPICAARSRASSTTRCATSARSASTSRGMRSLHSGCASPLSREDVVTTWMIVTSAPCAQPR